MIKTEHQLEQTLIRLKFKGLSTDDMPVNSGIFLECEPKLFDELAKKSMGIAGLATDNTDMKVMPVMYLGIKVTLIKGMLSWNNN
jgi:hypothetical protein